MNTRLSMLMIIAGVQLLIVAALLLASTSSTRDGPEPFLSFEPESIDRVMLDNGDGGELTLARSDDGWVLASGMPADDEKMTGVLSKLHEL